MRRRLRIAQTEGRVPAFADDVAMAELSGDDETEAEIADAGGDQPEGQPQAGAVATVERPGEGNGGDPRSGGETDASAERRQRNAERKARRQARRKHGRNR
jgi:hypothetical protein